MAWVKRDVRGAREGVAGPRCAGAVAIRLVGEHLAELGDEVEVGVHARGIS